MSALRQEIMEKWLKSQSAYSFDLEGVRAASSDASFRRYFRVNDRNSGRDFIVMDAPPEKEDTRPFVAIAGLLQGGGVHAPLVLAQDAAQGFLLLSDFGNTTMLTALGQGDFSADALYRQATVDLVHMQANVQPDALPVYAAEKLRSEMDLFDDWYLGRHFNATLTDQERLWLENIKAILVQSALSEGQVFVHRDYHSRNLMVTGSSELGKPVLGMLDFQDAVKGPLSYDLVSILRDAYVEWPEEQTVDWAIRYWEQAKKTGLPVPGDVSEFYRQFDFMGLQRHLKVLGIFCRLYYRDGKDQYLNDLPLVLAYVRNVAARYIAFKPLLLLLDRLENKAAQVTYSF